MRATLWNTAVAVCISASTAWADNASPKQVLKNVTEQAEATIRAVKEGDHRGLAERTHPKLVEMIGGTEKFVAAIEKLTKQIKAGGFTITSATIQTPAPVVEGKGDFYVIVPTQMVMTKSDGTRITQASFLLGVSADGGRTWRFLDGSGLKTRKSVEQILPDLPAGLELPERVAPVVERP